MIRHALLRPTRLAALSPLAALAAASLLSAQASPLPEGTRAGIDQVFAFVEPDAPGCAVGVIRAGELAYGKGYGLANLDWGIPIGTSTVFDIGSVSKQFTATAVALLEMDGVLSLDDDVRRWVPEMPDYGAPITLRHLLNHTSGVRDYLTLLSLAGFDFANVFDEADGVRLITRQRALNFPPGSEFLYSNSGYLLLAHVVRRASGTSLRSFLEARVFEPLGMGRSSVWDRNTEILPGRATGYARDADAGWRMNHAWNFQMGGDGQVITSIEDLARWDANFYEPVVGGAGLLERLHARGLLANGDTIAYALGLTVDRYRGVRRVQHGGSWAGFRAILARFPDQRTSVAVACNRGDANPAAHARAVADLVLADAFPEPSPEPPAPQSGAPAAGAEAAAPALTFAALSELAGSYASEEIDAVFEIAVDGDRLTLRRPNAEPVPLRPRADDEFQAPAAVLTFQRDGGRVTGFKVNAGRVTGIVFERLR